MCCWNAGIYFLLLLTPVDFFGSTFYFLEIRKFLNYLSTLIIIIIINKPVVASDRLNLTNSLSNTGDQSRLLAVTSPYSGDWLNSLPLSGCRLRLDDHAIQIAVGLWLGANICEPHHALACLLMQKGCMDCHVEGALVGPHDITAWTTSSGVPIQRPISRQSRSRQACSELTASDPNVWR